MGWYIIELPDDSLTPYAKETESGIVSGWGLKPKRKVDLDELLRIADELEVDYFLPDESYSDMLSTEEVLKFEREMAKRIRKAVDYE